MRTVTSPGIIYRMISYSDRSAIAFSFMRDYGKVKLFINKAFTKRGGVLKFIPGSINFHKKADTDLHKFYSLNQDINYYHFLDVPEIYLRLHLIFEIYDILNEVEVADEFLWKLLMKFNKENINKAMVYMIYHLINNAGIMFDVNYCTACGAEFTNGKLGVGGLYCNQCSVDRYTIINPKNSQLLKKLTVNNEYKSTNINRKTEFEMLNILIKYIERTESVKIKGLDILETLV